MPQQPSRVADQDIHGQFVFNSIFSIPWWHYCLLCHFDPNLERLENFYIRLRQHGLKLKPSQCNLFRTKVKYLSHGISKNGIETDNKIFYAVQHGAVPINRKVLRSFIGFTWFYRKFVRGYSKIFKPLCSLLREPGSKWRWKASDPSFVWQEYKQTDFTELIDCLTRTPVLGYTDYSKPFDLHVDASAEGLGAILCQRQGDQQRIIAFASRDLLFLRASIQLLGGTFMSNMCGFRKFQGLSLCASVYYPYRQ